MPPSPVNLLKTILFALAILTPGFSLFAEELSFDVVVYGATPSGVAAATNAGREGVSVALVEETYQVGGLTSGGLAHTDFKTFQSLGGAWKEFMDGVQQYYRETYGDGSPQHLACGRGGYYEPRVARLVFEKLLASGKVRVFTHRQLAEAKNENDRLVSATFRPANSSKGYPLPQDGPPLTLHAKVFIDATYEGDLLAEANVPYRLGSEARSEFDEALAPEEASGHLMATNFRICLTRDPANRLPLPKPASYDRTAYTKVIGLIQAGKVAPKEFGGAGWLLDDLIRVRPVPNQKSDFNDTMGSPISIKLIEETHAWPEAKPQERARIFDLARERALGMFWFLANDPELPDWVRAGMTEWGLPKDEFVESGHWTPVLYLREGRRLKGVKTFTQHDTVAAAGQVRAKLNSDGIAIGDYSINSHGTHHQPDGKIGGVLSVGVSPWQLPYLCLVPEKTNGLLASVPVSASHVGYATIRMEPAWSGIGQAAGVAAAQAVKSGREVRDVPIVTLQRRLHELGVFTIYIADVPAVSPYFRAAQFFGTHGFLHEVQENGRANGFFDGPTSRPSSQWSDNPRNGHALNPEKTIDEALAASWLQRFATSFPEVKVDAPPFAADGVLTRGEFLNRLFALLPE
jgi:hypothetical protein